MDDEPRFLQEIKEMLGSDDEPRQDYNSIDRTVIDTFQSLAKHFGHIRGFAVVVTFDHAVNGMPIDMYIHGNRYEMAGATEYLHEVAKDVMYRQTRE